MGIGTPVYYFRLPFNVSAYLQTLLGLEGKATFYFLLHGTYPGDAGKELQGLLQPVLSYNVRKANADPSLDSEKFTKRI